MPVLKKLRFLNFVGLSAYFLLIQNLFAQSIVVKDFADAPVPIALTELVRENPERDGKMATDIETMLTADLIFSRIFKVIPSETFLKATISPAIDQIKVDPWRQTGADYVVKGKAYQENGAFVVDIYVFNTTTAKLVLQKTYKTKRAKYTILAHMIGDDIMKIVTGSLGLFSTRIAFAYKPPRGRFKEVWSMDFNGRDPRPLIQNGRTNLSPAWSKDGKTIYYTSASVVDWNLWKTDENGRSKQVTSFPGSALGPTMHPDGKHMVISLSKDGNAELYLITMDGKVEKRLTKKSTIEIAPSVSPDGNKICYSSGLLGNLHIYVMDLATLNSERLTRVGTLNDSCAWHPSENRILFSGMDIDREFDIFSMDDHGNNMERLTYDAKNNETPSWSPDGSLIVFSSRRTGRDEIYVMKADGTQMTKITDLPGDASQPDWSPRLGYSD